MKKKTTEEFIINAWCKHQDKYNYKLVDYKNSSTKVKIVCPVHGTFEQTPNHHLRGQGCKKCGHINTNNKQRKSTEEFIIDAYCKHGDKYNYKLVDYKNRQTKIKIICPVHGTFEQRPNNHLRYGCNKCGNDISGIKQRFNINQYIERCKFIHNNKYDYSLIKSESTIKDKVKIICPEHGVFEQKIGNHLYKEYGCPKCSCIVSKQELELQDWIKSMAKKLNTEEFIERSKKIHGSKYDYSLVEYHDMKTKVKIICPVHGVFEQRPGNHINGKQGCPDCGHINTNNKQRKSTEGFIVNAYCKHGNRYNYKLVDYKNSKSKVKIICPVHGTFEQRADHHVNGHGCKECSSEKSSLVQADTFDEFLMKANNIHNNKYQYMLCDGDHYRNNRTKIRIICPLHGEFLQVANYHLNGQGCPKCSCIVSKQELELQDWIKNGISVITNDHSLIAPYELDIVIPEKKIAIEYNGLYWHSETQGKTRKYHLDKYLACKEKGYRLIQIWENEWVLQPEIVKSFILSALGKYKYKVHGRKCIVKKVSPKEARTMYNENHIQGFQCGTHHGLYYNDELVSLMTIKKYMNSYMLERFVNKKYHIVYGAFSKLLKSFDDIVDSDLYTFADVRHFTGGVYEKNGFEYVHTTLPNYWYFKNSTIDVYHRRHFQKKNINKRHNNGELEHFNSNKTEYQNMLDNGFHRIWDCGNIKFVKKYNG